MLSLAMHGTNIKLIQIAYFLSPYEERYIEFSLLSAAWLKKLQSYRDWFLEQDKLKSDESKRIGECFNSGELFGFDGSFRQLKVD
jgi:hypothetical protein